MAGRHRSFYLKVKESLESEGLADRAILRTFLADCQTDAVEVLLVAHGRHAETVWCDSDGTLIHGPIDGFGPGKT